MEENKQPLLERKNIKFIALRILWDFEEINFWDLEKILEIFLNYLQNYEF